MSFFHFIPLEESRGEPLQPQHTFPQHHPQSPVSRDSRERRHALAQEKRASQLLMRQAKLAAHVMHVRAVATQQKQQHRRPHNQSHQQQQQQHKQRQAALILQSWWRRLLLLPLLRPILPLRLSPASLSSQGFEEATRLVQSPTLCLPVHNLLLALRRHAPSPPPCLRGRKAERSLFSAYVIAAFPATVEPEPHSDLFDFADDVTEREEREAAGRAKALHEAAVGLADSFATWTSQMVEPHVSVLHVAHLQKSFLAHFSLFCHRFEQWRAPDAHNLIDRIRHHYADLLAFREQIRGHAREWDVYAPHVDQEKVRLLHQLGDLGASQVIEELRHLDHSLVAGAASHPPEMTSSVPPSPLSADDFKRFIAHNVALNPDFRLEADETSGEEEDRFWEEVDVHLAHGNHLLLQGILGYLRTEINDVTPTQAMRTELEGLLEVEEVPNQETAHKLIGRMVGFLGRICAPVRDEDLDRINKALVAHKQLPSPASLLRALVRVVRLMRLDLANHHLASIRPLLSTLAPQYEREFLANQISSGALSLPKTRDWLLSTRDLLLQTTGTQPPPEEIAAKALSRLILSPDSSSLASDTLPEILQLDQERLILIQKEIKRLALYSTIEVMVKNMVPQVRQDPRFLGGLRSSLLSLLDDSHSPPASPEHLSVHVASQLNRFLSSGKQAELTAQKESWLTGMVVRACGGNDTILRLMLQRIQDTLEKGLTNQEQEASFWAKANLDSVQEPLLVQVRLLSLIFRYAWAAFSSFCIEICKDGP